MCVRVCVCVWLCVCEGKLGAGVFLFVSSVFSLVKESSRWRRLSFVVTCTDSMGRRGRGMQKLCTQVWIKKRGGGGGTQNRVASSMPVDSRRTMYKVMAEDSRRTMYKVTAEDIKTKLSLFHGISLTCGKRTWNVSHERGGEMEGEGGEGGKTQTDAILSQLLR